MKQKFDITALKQTQSLAESLAAAARPGDVFALYGDLGSGKTEFARYFIKYSYPQQNITSPTFTLVQTYGDIYHFDLYRLKTAAEVYELGWEDALLYGITLVEWPEIVENLLPKETVRIRIYHNNENREAEIC